MKPSDFDPCPVIMSLIAGELARSRHVSVLDPMFLDLEPETELGAGAIGTDSLDLLNLASAVAEMFHLYETGVEEYLLRYRKVENWCEIVQVSLAKRAEHITFRSSGSTGMPKRCVHSLHWLQAEASEHAARLQGCHRVLSMVPSHHIYGFIWAALLPRHLEVPVLDVRRWPAARIAQEVRAGDLLLGVPASWSLLSRALDLLPAGVLGITSGAPCPPALFNEVCRSGLDLTEIYGSSETAGIGFRRRAGEPFSLLSLWKRGDAPDLLVRMGADGEAESIQAPDHLDWQSERTFQIEGRRDGAVQVGGNNVFPDKVAEVLRSCPGIEDCTVRLMRPEEGDRLKAYVVWRDDAAPEIRSEGALRAWTAANLQPFERPATFTFGMGVPVNEMNKSADW